MYDLRNYDVRLFLVNNIQQQPSSPCANKKEDPFLGVLLVAKQIVFLKKQPKNLTKNCRKRLFFRLARQQPDARRIGEASYIRFAPCMQQGLQRLLRGL